MSEHDDDDDDERKRSGGKSATAAAEEEESLLDRRVIEEGREQISTQEAEIAQYRRGATLRSCCQ